MTDGRWPMADDRAEHQELPSGASRRILGHAWQDRAPDQESGMTVEPTDFTTDLPTPS